MNDMKPAMRFDRPDALLQAYAAAAEHAKDQENLKLPLTLQIGGFLVSGTLVPYVVWRRALIKRMDGYLNGGENVYGDLMPETMRAPEHRETVYLHMIDVVVIGGPTPVPSDGGAEWRGRLESVDGWWFGNLAKDE